MPIIRIADNVERHKEESRWLLNHGSNVYSQSGEDGIIAAIFEKIGTENKWSVEFGAWDGVHFSNTCRLIREEDWSSVMIEGNPDRCTEIRKNHPDADKVIAANRWVGFERGSDTIDDILGETPIPKNFDLISIDIDSIDWYIWQSIIDYRPRVVVIEYNFQVPNEVIFVQDCDTKIREGCSIASLVELGKEKKYELVAVNSLNAFFVVEEDFDKLGVSDNSIPAMRPNTHSYVWSGFNGKVYNTMKTLPWKQNQSVAPDGLVLRAPEEGD